MDGTPHHGRRSGQGRSLQRGPHGLSWQPSTPPPQPLCLQTRPLGPELWTGAPPPCRPWSLALRAQPALWRHRCSGPAPQDDPANHRDCIQHLQRWRFQRLPPAELDTQGLISGVAVSEPAIEMPANPGVTVRRGSAEVAVTGKRRWWTSPYANLYQACASLAPSVSTSPAAVLPPALAVRPCRLRPIAVPRSGGGPHGLHHGHAGRRGFAKAARLRLGAGVQRLACVAGCV